jgi:hypothetical protein
MTPTRRRDDLADLRAYLAAGGLAGLARSSIGPMLDHLARAGESRRCDCCGGIGRIPDGGDESRYGKELGRVLADRAWGVAILRTPKAPKGDIRHLLEYRALRDSGDFAGAERYRRANRKNVAEESAEENRGEAAAIGRYIRAEMAAQRAENRQTHTDRACLVCRGTGWRPVSRTTPAKDEWELDARPTGSSVRAGGGGVDIGEEATERLGMIAGRLARVRAASPELAEALSRYYAPQSGGALALWEMVEPGKRLLKNHAIDGAPPSAVFAQVVEEARQNPTHGIARELDDVKEAARGLAERAHRAWEASSSPATWRRETGSHEARRPKLKAPRNQSLDEVSALVRRAMGGQV